MANEDYEKARARAKELKDFYTHLITFIIFNAAFITINLLASPKTLWFYWITIFWGIGLLFHAFDVFALKGRYFGSDWEERKTQELMEKERRRKAG